MGAPQTMELLIPARKGRALEVPAGAYMKVVDVRGKQVADMIAVCRNTPGEYFSPGHTRSCLASLRLRIGDALYSNLRRPLLRVVEDTVGRHDLVVPCCDRYRYARDFGRPDHDNCLDNLVRALAGFPVNRKRLPEAINIFMNNRYEPDGRIITEEPTSGPGDYILFEALEDLIIAVSACPQDLTPCNGWNPTEILIRVEGAGPGR